MSRLKSKKSFPFRSYGGREPTIAELRAEIEELYRFIIEQVDEVIEEVREEIPDEG